MVATSTAPPRLPTTNPTEVGALARLEAQQEELLRLRGEVAQLRLASRQPTANAATAPKLTPEDIDALATEKLVAEATATKIIDAMKKLGVAARIFALDNQDRLPTTFEEFESVLAGFPSADDILRGGALRELLEFFPNHERAISEAEPQMILFQEKKPRRLPNGTWECIYCLIDGSVLRINRPKGDFSEFELPRTATPANAPAKP